MDSNLTVYNKIGYVESYEKMDPDLIHYWGIPGKYSDKIFAVDTKASKSFINNLVNNTTTYTQAQVFNKVAKTSTKSSKGKSIIVLNGSQIGGLATAAKTTLTNAGYKVKKIGDHAFANCKNLKKIGDYTAATLTQTKIIVKEDGVGKDLVKYFSNPVVETGTVDTGYDIKIIIGTADANN